ncbi:hypothetical protein EAI89_18530 [Eubacterium sp. am_0171]|nr:hypothetical protein EAI89_18530 [Eubacterium sp. am_0171]
MEPDGDASERGSCRSLEGHTCHFKGLRLPLSGASPPGSTAGWLIRQDSLGHFWLGAGAGEADVFGWTGMDFCWGRFWN